MPTFKVKLPSAKVTQRLHAAATEASNQEIDEYQAKSLAMARIKAARLRIMGRPLDDQGEPLDPQLPLNLVELSSEELGTLYNEFAIMCQYARQVMAITEVERAAHDRIDEFTRSKVRLQKSGTVQDKNAKTEIDQRVRKSSFNVLKGDSLTTLTGALFESYIIGKDVCSREMTRRQSEQQGRI